MEQQAASLGMANTLHYMYPNNPGPPASLQPALEALNLGSNIETDIHVGASGGIEVADALFASNPSFDQGAVNCEVRLLFMFQSWSAARVCCRQCRTDVVICCELDTRLFAMNGFPESQ